jgi:hypothetical protein
MQSARQFPSRQFCHAPGGPIHNAKTPTGKGGYLPRGNFPDAAIVAICYINCSITGNNNIFREMKFCRQCRAIGERGCAITSERGYDPFFFCDWNISRFILFTTVSRNEYH